jgi:hypothetical protein
VMKFDVSAKSESEMSLTRTARVVDDDGRSAVVGKTGVIYS